MHIFSYPDIHPFNHLSDQPSTHFSQFALPSILPANIQTCNCLLVRPPIHPSIHPSIHPPIHPSIHLLIHPPIHPSTHLSTHLSIHPPIHPSTHLSIHPPIHPSIHPSIHPPIHPPIHPSYKYITHALWTGNCSRAYTVMNNTDPALLELIS